MKQELSGFSTVEIEVRFNDGYNDTVNPYLWIKQKCVIDNSLEDSIVIPVSAWQDLSRAVGMAVNGAAE